jgi:hypothetical protein
MTDLSRLNVSLTKHGAHKIAFLLRQYDKDEVLEHLSGSVDGINIERAQALKTLAYSNGTVPAFWNTARERGSETLNALTLVAVILSHHELMSAMKQSENKKRYVGRIRRGVVITGKAFTNFAHIIEELGFSTEHSVDHVDFDLHKLFLVPRLNELVSLLLTAKLKAAGWSTKNSLVDEAVSLGLHEVFAIAEPQFRAWLATGEVIEVGIDEEREEADFFFNADDKATFGKFTFKPGHNAKKTGSVAVSAAKKPKQAELLHNAIQNGLYEQLVKKYGNACVGTENATGHGTSIDVVVKTDTFCWFYEIKTSRSVKACIRQAIPQLLEYAYWDAAKGKADELVIVGPKAVTKQAEAYLEFLRREFGLNLRYEHFEVA